MTKVSQINCLIGVAKYGHTLCTQKYRYLMKNLAVLELNVVLTLAQAVGIVSCQGGKNDWFPPLDRTVASLII